MRIENLVFENLHCYCCINQTAAGRIAYILYPAGISTDWVLRTATEHGISIVIISGIDWDNDLTPWPALGVPKGSPDFGGRGSLFFSKLTQTVIPNIEKRFNCIINPERTLVGVSLSGLFTLWQWPQVSSFIILPLYPVHSGIMDSNSGYIPIASPANVDDASCC